MASALEVHSIGGCGGFGMNATLFAAGGRALLVDFGVGFPRAPLPGVSLTVPDADPLARRFPELAAIVLTHAHDDHCAGLPHLPAPWRESPVYGPPLALAAATDRLQDAGRNLPPRFPVALGQVVDIPPFSVTFLAATHSVPDNAMLAIDTPAGLVVHTADFKLDPRPVAGPLTDLDGLAKLGRRGVRLLLMDSTGARRDGRTGAESSVTPHLQAAVAEAAGQVVVSTFATHLHRIQTTLGCARAASRRAALLGPRMTRMVNHGLDLGLMDAPAGVLAAADALADEPPARRVWLAGGCQGEVDSALSRLSRGAEPKARIGEGDVVIVSASVVPGNEALVSQLLDRFLRLGAEVHHAGDEPGLHVSGHASRDELVQLIQLLAPEALVPIHGDLLHLTAAAALARGLPHPPRQTVILLQGDGLVLDAGGARRLERTPVETLRVDETGLLVPPEVVRERRRLAAAGFVLLRLPRRARSGDAREAVRLEHGGVAGWDDVAGAVLRLAREHLDAAPPDAPLDALEAEVARRIAAFLRRGRRHRPSVQVVID